MWQQPRVGYTGPTHVVIAEVASAKTTLGRFTIYFILAPAATKRVPSLIVALLQVEIVSLWTEGACLTHVNVAFHRAGEEATLLLDRKSFSTAHALHLAV